MIYYFSAPESTIPATKKYLLSQRVSFLMTFAHSTKQWRQFYEKGQNFMMDSGAFSAWNSGKEVDREEYLKFCQTLPEDVYKINLDVIPKTGAGPQEIEKACEASFTNYLYLKKHLKNVLPVHHYGDKVEWLNRMCEETDYICVSPANDTHESIKKKYLDFVFSQIDHTQTKTHALGYTSRTGIRKYPFFSVDSISYKTTQMRGRVVMCRSDGQLINLELKEYAEILNKQFSTKKTMKSQREIVEIGATETIRAYIKFFRMVTEDHKTRDFSYLKQQLTLF